MTPDAETVALLIEIGRYGCVWPQRRGKVRREMQRRRVTQLRDDVGASKPAGPGLASALRGPVGGRPASLFRGLVTAENELKLPGGSISSAVAVARLSSQKAQPRGTLHALLWSIEARAKTMRSPSWVAGSHPHPVGDSHHL
jgi:hypothetical protein